MREYIIVKTGGIEVKCCGIVFFCNRIRNIDFITLIKVSYIKDKRLNA